MSAGSSWPSVPLAEAYWFQEGPGVRNWQFTTSGIKLLNVANIEKAGTLNLSKTDRHLDEAEVAKKYPHFLVDAGDLVIASSGISFDDDGLLRTRGAFIGETDLPLCLNTSTIRFKAVEGVSDLHFLRLWLNSHEFRSQITKLVTGTAQQNFGPSHLKATKITLPPLPEQRRIAEVLDRAEALRAKRRAALTQLDTLAQVIFLDLFGNPATNPKGWKAKPLRELVSEFRYGTSNKSQAYGKPALRIPNVIGGVIDFSVLKLVPVDDAEFERLRLIDGDALFVRTNGNPDFVGRCAVFDSCLTAKSGFSSDNFIFASYLIRARLRMDRITPIFLREFMLGTEGRRQLRSRSKTSAGQFNINTENLGAIAVPLPPLGLQHDFAHRIAAVEKLKTAHHASLAELDALFASLQHRAFRGKL